MAEFQRPESGVGQSRRGVSEKRPRGSPTGITPLQKGKRPAVQPKDTGHRPGKRPQSRRRLPFSSTADMWSELEDSCHVFSVSLIALGLR